MSDCKKCLCLNACQEHYAVSESCGIRNHDRCKCFVNKDEYVEVVHGRWLVCGQECFVCSVCHDNVMINYNYCPYCGAKMDLEE